MNINRRNFLKGLLASVATGAFIKNGVAQPMQVIAEPERQVFDMAANTWRGQLQLSPHINCRCVIVPVLRQLDGRYSHGYGLWNYDDRQPMFDQMQLYVPEHLDNSIITQAVAASRAPYLRSGTLSNFGIKKEEIQAHIDELVRGRNDFS